MLKENRVKRVLDALREMGLSQMLIVDPMSIYYLTGVYIAPFERFYALYLRADGKHVYFLNKLFTVPEEVGVEKVWYDDTDPAAEIVAKYLDPNQTLGVDKDLTARFLLPLMERKAATGFVNASLAVDKTRGVKDAEEQELMRVSSDINDKAIAKFKTLIHEGVTEKEVAEQTLKIYQDLGADGFSFEPLVAFGANAADPHHAPDDTVVKPGDCVLFDVGCIRDGYCSDMTRTFYESGDLPNREGRKVFKHSPEIYHVKVTLEEARKGAALMAERLNAFTGPVAVVAPMRGFRDNTQPGDALYDPEVDACLRDTVKAALAPHVKWIEVDCNANDPLFAETVMSTWLQLVKERA